MGDMCSSVYDHVTDLKSCGFPKTQKSKYLENDYLFRLKEVIKGYDMAKNSFLAEITFKILIPKHLLIDLLKSQIQISSLAHIIYINQKQ